MQIKTIVSENPTPTGVEYCYFFIILKVGLLPKKSILVVKAYKNDLKVGFCF